MRRILVAAGIFLSAALSASAADIVNVWSHQWTEIDRHGVCREVHNDGGTGIAVPVRRAQEWSSGGNSFINNTGNMPGVWVKGCAPPRVEKRGAPVMWTWDSWRSGRGYVGTRYLNLPYVSRYSDSDSNSAIGMDTVSYAAVDWNNEARGRWRENSVYVAGEPLGTNASLVFGNLHSQAWIGNRYPTGGDNPGVGADWRSRYTACETSWVEWRGGRYGTLGEALGTASKWDDRYVQNQVFPFKREARVVAVIPRGVNSCVAYQHWMYIECFKSRSGGRAWSRCRPAMQSFTAVYQR